METAAARRSRGALDRATFSLWGVVVRGIAVQVGGGKVRYEVVGVWTTTTTSNGCVGSVKMMPGS
jgi:uncharacterized protein YyaL (SSP411 family)